MATVSFRQHIRWGRDTPSEPTSTLVLTSPARYFVDIRVLKEALTSPNGAVPDRSSKLSIKHLDWAIGGTSSSQPRTRPDGTAFSHSVFTHWVDSRTREPENATDAGDMFPQPDGTTLETGRMVNPATGLETDYEELWLDGRPEHPSALPKWTVLQLHDDTKDTRGLFAQLGPYAQVVLRVGDLFTAERWEWNHTTSKWEKAFSIGHEKAPFLDDVIPAIRKGSQKGDNFDARTGTWVVVDADT